MERTFTVPSVRRSSYQLNETEWVAIFARGRGLTLCPLKDRLADGGLPRAVAAASVGALDN